MKCCKIIKIGEIQQISKNISIFIEVNVCFNIETDKVYEIVLKLFFNYINFIKTLLLYWLIELKNQAAIKLVKI